MKVGVISDTHGLLRPEALKAFQGCERIIHGGDIGNQEVLDQLASIAPPGEYRKAASKARKKTGKTSGKG
jgi:predicted phosphodiesterase